MARTPVSYVTDLDVWQVLLSPVRFEIVEAMRRVAPCSMRELAATLARPADALYRHIEKLQEGGFVVAAGFRKSGRHTEQIFDLTADDFQLDVSKDPSGKAALQAVLDTARTTFKSAEKALEASGKAGAFNFAPGRRNLIISYELAWLTPEEIAQVITHMRAIKEITDKKTRPDAEGDVELFAVLSVMTPVTRRVRRRRGQPVGAGANLENTAAVASGSPGAGGGRDE